jgi:hypothetical protein
VARCNDHMFSESSLKIQGGQSPLLPVTYSPDFPGLKWGLSLGKAGWIFFHFVKVYDLRMPLFARVIPLLAPGPRAAFVSQRGLEIAPSRKA